MHRSVSSAIRVLLGCLLLAMLPLAGQARDSYGTETIYDTETSYLQVSPPEINITAELGQDIAPVRLQVSVSQGSGKGYEISGNVPWLTVSPSTGSASTVPNNHDATFNKALLTAETKYNATITVNAPETVNTLQFVPVTVNVISSLKLVYPLQSGEVWTHGRPYTVKWTVNSTAITSSYFQILKAGVVKYQSSAKTGQGSLEQALIVPATLTPGTDYAVRIIGVTASGNRIVTGNALTIRAQPLVIDSPAAGAVWTISKAAAIQWRINEPAKIGAPLYFYLYKYVATQTPLPFVKVAELGSLVTSSNSGAYNFTVPDLGKGDQLLWVLATYLSPSELSGLAQANPDLLDWSDGQIKVVNPPIRVIAPNEDTTWTMGEKADIQWRSNSSTATIVLELWNATQKVADLGTDSSSLAEHVKTITVPATVPAGEQYRVRAYRQDKPTWEDFSDQPFRIVYQDLKLVSPNGGESVSLGLPLTVSWIMNTETMGTEINIELWNSNGYVRQLARYAGLTSGLNTRTFMLADNIGIVPGYPYWIRVIRNGYDEIYDASDTGFIIRTKPIKVSKPNGGETYYCGKTFPISWSISDLALGGTAVDFELWWGPYKYLDLGSQSSSTGSGTFNAVLPEWLWDGEQYSVRVISQKDRRLFDDSDEYFRIATAPIRLYQPNENAVLTVGQKAWFEWVVNPLVTGGTDVEIHLVRNGAYVASIARYTGSASHTYMEYTIPNVPPASDYRVRIYSHGRLFSDESNMPVTVKMPPVTVISPNLGSEVWMAGSTGVIHWKTYLPDAGNAVNFELWRATTGQKIMNLGGDSNAAGENSKSITVPNVDTRSDYIIRAVSVRNPAFYDESDRPFTIRAAPPAPTNLTAASGMTAVTLRWDPVSVDAFSGYYVYRATSASGTYTKLTASPVWNPAYTDSTGTANVVYYYRVTAVNAYGQESAKSNYATGSKGVVVLQMPDVRRGAGREAMLHIYSPALNGVLGNRMTIWIAYDRRYATPLRFEKTALTNEFKYTGSIQTGTTNYINYYIIQPSSTPAANKVLSGAGRIFDVIFKISSSVPWNSSTVLSFAAGTRLLNTSGAAMAVNKADTASLTFNEQYRMGDINGDSQVTSADVSYAMARVGNPASLSALQLVAADVSGDGKFDISDVQLIQKLAAGQSINPVQLPNKPAAQKTAQAALAAPIQYNVALGTVIGYTSETAQVPVTVSPASGIAAIQMQVNFDDAALEFVNVTKGSLTNSSKFTVVPPTKVSAGAYSFGILGTEGITGTGSQVANLIFKVKSRPGAQVPLLIASCLMTNAEAVDVTNDGSTIMPTHGKINVSRRNAAGKSWAYYQ